jgi:hypothetical protein
VTQIGPVLDLEFPDGIQRILSALKPLAIDLQSILQLDCLAGSDFTFYAFWMVRCFLLPGLMLAAVGLQYVYERRRVDHATAMGYFKANAFVVVFLCYVSILDISIDWYGKVLTGMRCSLGSPGSATKLSRCSTVETSTAGCRCSIRTTPSSAPRTSTRPSS